MMIDYLMGKDKVQRIENVLKRNSEASNTACEIIIGSNGQIKKALNSSKTENNT